MSTTNLFKQQLILSTIHHHDESMKRLETKYTDFISKLLHQKHHIIMKMKEAFNQRMADIHTLDASQVSQQIQAAHFKAQNDFNINSPSFPELPILDRDLAQSPSRSDSPTTFEPCPANIISGTESDTSCSILSDASALFDQDTATTVTPPPPRPPPPPPKPCDKGIQSLKDGLSDVFTEFKEEYIQIKQNQTDKYHSLQQTKQQLQNDLEHTIHQTNKYKKDNVCTSSFLRFLQERKNDIVQRKHAVEQEIKSLAKEKESSLECIDGLSKLFGCVIPDEMESGLSLKKRIKMEEEEEDNAQDANNAIEPSQGKHMLNVKHDSEPNELKNFVELILISYTKRVPCLCVRGVALDAFGFSLINLFILYQFIEIRTGDLKERSDGTHDVKITFKYRSGLSLKGFLLSEFDEKDDYVLKEEVVWSKVNEYKESRTYDLSDVFYGITFSSEKRKCVLILKNMTKGGLDGMNSMHRLCGFFVVSRGIVCCNNYHQKKLLFPSQIGSQITRKTQRKRMQDKKRRKKQRRSVGACRVRDRGRWRNRNSDRDDTYYAYRNKVRSRSRSRSRTRYQYQDWDRTKERSLEINYF
eukprot:81582_1